MLTMSTRAPRAISISAIVSRPCRDAQWSGVNPCSSLRSDGRERESVFEALRRLTCNSDRFPSSRAICERRRRFLDERNRKCRPLSCEVSVRCESEKNYYAPQFFMRALLPKRKSATKRHLLHTYAFDVID